jgi:hypothetical protein
LITRAAEQKIDLFQSANALIMGRTAYDGMAKPCRRPTTRCPRR